MRIKVIINPRSIKGDVPSLITVLRTQFNGSLAGIEHSLHRGHATAMAQLACEEGVDTIVAVGGDGTVNGVVGGIVGRDVALGVIPWGTANDLGRHHGIPAGVLEACETIRRRRLRPVDVIRVNDRYFASAGGIGFTCEVARLADAMKQRGRFWKRLHRLLGGRLYVLAALRTALNGHHRGMRVRLQWNGHSLVTHPLSIIVTNQAIVGGSFRVAPGAVDDDGLFDV